MPGGDSDIMIPMKQENESYCIGQVVEGMITGIKPYGAFVRLNDGASGLIHISEISHGYVKDVSRFVSRGEKIIVKIIDIDPLTGQPTDCSEWYSSASTLCMAAAHLTGQLKLSLKALRSHRYQSSRPPGHRLPDKIGFSSLEKALPQWLKQAQKEE